ncbi:FAD-binding FR-type domain-containing protein [Mycena sanguinolenta]|uniref:NADPH--hemoprotein reductase n=1 Tax=Mycena sanguinolenta TaxID=230812 RepID=A0A8H6YV27_9AGAR|nr:FAD-binding FR-type domain-containing protein [Mycena sanguinolenta]
MAATPEYVTVSRSEMPTIVFHLHGKSAVTDGISLDVQAASLDELRKTVAAKFSIALHTTVSFHKSAPADTIPGDLEVLGTIEAILNERTVAILISGKKVRPVPGPTGGIPFIGGYSEIYPDFIGNYQRLLTRYGHIVHVGYLGKSVYLTDDPDCAGIVLGEGEYFSKEIGDNHPLFPLKMSIPNGLFTADSSNPTWSTSHKFMMTAMGARAMRNYVRTMDRTANRLVNCFNQLLEKGQSFDAFPWGLRAAGQTIGEVAIEADLKMLDSAESEIANIFHVISVNLQLTQTLFRKGRVYRALPNPEIREQRAVTAEANAFVDQQAARILRDGHTIDMPIDKAAVSTTSLLDYLLHATDEEGRKMDDKPRLPARSDGSGSASPRSPAQARKLYASLIASGLRKDKEITAEELGKLEYLDWFIKETQRLYNPAFQPTRQAQKDVIMPGGFFVPKGSQVTVALHSVMVNPEHWKDPLTFDPERWGTEAVRKRHKYAYIPFAAGGRGCIGFNFALQEIKIVLARVVLNFQIENTTEGAVIYDPDFLLYRPLNFRMRLHKQVDPEEVLTEGTTIKVEEKIQAPQPAVGNKALPRFWALHASNNGTCEGMAGDVAAKARQLGFADVQVVRLGDSPLADAKKTEDIAAGSNFFVICVSTYNGEPPDSALSFSEMLDTEIKAGNSLRFAGINFCVFGAGNTQWGPTFQAFPKKVDANLAALGGNRIFEKGTGDSNADQDSDFTQWATRLWAATAANFGVDVEGASQDRGNVLTNAPAYHADSVKVEFIPHSSPVAGDPFLAQPPIDGFVKATVRANVELVDENTPLPRGIRLLTFDVPEGFTYREGDHMEVFPENDLAVVDRLLVALNFVADAVFTVKEVGSDVNPTSLAAFLVDRGGITLRDLLLYYADLAGPVQRSTLMMLSCFFPDDAKFQSLRETLSVAGSASDNDAPSSFTQKNRNFSELVANYPVLAQALDLKKLLVVLRATQPRRYSISSSPLVDPRVAKLCVGVEDLRAADYQGLCSGFLARAEVGHVVWVRPRSSQDSFHLPTDPTVPVVMVAAGTGISAFLGFLEHRRAQGIKVQEYGGQAPFRLFYGTSYHDMPTLRGIVKSYVEDGTVLVEAAYSEEDAPRRFAQHILIRDALKIWSDISNDGHVYVCGSAARVGQGVRQSLMHIAEQVGGVTDPAGWLAGLKKEGRYSEDVFG